MPTPLPAELSSRRILIVEDEAHARRVNVDILEELGFSNIRQAMDGAEALDILETTRSPIDLVICDLAMPKMDGFAFVEKVRKSRQYYRDTPIIMLTGSANADAVIRLKSLGVNGYLVKPMTPEAILDRIKYVLRFRL
ncbi:MAG: response regulator [Ferrovibrio sp.]|jgi:two-component system chemotaxis response regulator CheY|uniref:response regulator n=1 Tax=Ferrovibrio sp. TaxID=1917215 RepID=UPI001B604624|nr:response regulator [Ferrovibrio sp.]